MMKRSYRAALGAALALGCAGLAPVARAAATVRVEFMLAAQPDGNRGQVVNQPGQAMGSAPLTVVGSTPVLSPAAPSFGSTPRGYVRVIVISGAAVVAFGPSPTVTDTNSVRIEAGREKIFPVNTGDKVALIEALVGPSTQAVADTNNASAQYETALTIGGSAVPVGRALKFQCTGAGTLTVTYANATTGVWSIPASPYSQTLNVAISGVAAATATGCALSNIY